MECSHWLCLLRPSHGQPARDAARDSVSLSTSALGFFTSKDQITVNRVSEEKSRMGIGMYSFMASMLYLTGWKSARWATTPPLFLRATQSVSHSKCMKTHQRGCNKSILVPS